MSFGIFGLIMGRFQGSLMDLMVMKRFQLYGMGSNFYFQFQQSSLYLGGFYGFLGLQWYLIGIQGWIFGVMGGMQYFQQQMFFQYGQ